MVAKNKVAKNKVDEEEVVEEIEKKRRVFLALDEDHPSQFATLSHHGHTVGSKFFPARCRVINEQFVGGHPTGRYILDSNAPDYEEQYETMRRIVDEGRYNIVELDTKDMAKQPDWFTKKTKTDKERLIEAQLKVDETSALILKGAKETAGLVVDGETKDKDIEDLTQSNKQLLEQVAALSKQMKKMNKEG